MLEVQVLVSQILPRQPRGQPKFPASNSIHVRIKTLNKAHLKPHKVLQK